MKKLLLPVVMVMALSGCVNLAPSYERPRLAVENIWPQGPAYLLATDEKAQRLPTWQEFYRSEQLRQVIALALENNRDLRELVLNIEKARAQYGVERADTFPTIAAGLSSTASNSSELQSGVDRTSHQHAANVAMSTYELDFFGRVRNLNESALESYLATQEAMRAGQSALISSVATTWLQLAADRELLRLQESILQSRERTFKLMQASYDLGAISRLDYEQAVAKVNDTRASIQQYVRRVAQDQNALQLLVGDKLDASMLPDSIPEGLVAPITSINVPSEVLLRRPDIVAAEHQLKGANASIGAARAAFFPSVSIMGSVGTGSLHMSDLFRSGSGMWSFAPKVNLPIFTGGLNKSNLELATVNQQLAVNNYELKIQTAFKEVADALATEGTVDKELQARKDYMRAMQKAEQLALVRYEQGASSYQDYLSIQEAMNQARQAYITAKMTTRASQVTLYKVLGGGSRLQRQATTRK